VNNLLIYLVAEMLSPKLSSPSLTGTSTRKPARKTKNKRNTIKTKQKELVPTPTSFSFADLEKPHHDNFEIEITITEQDVEAIVEDQQECRESQPTDGEELKLNSNPDQKDHTLKSPENTAKCLCPICGKKFGTNQRLSVHHLTHTGEKNFECATCSKFPSILQLIFFCFYRNSKF
jgi:hypothetical protein